MGGWGNGRKIILGQDPWLVYDVAHRIPLDTVKSFRDRGYIFLEHNGDLINTTIMRQEWLKVEDLGYENYVYKYNYKRYTKYL